MIVLDWKWDAYFIRKYFPRKKHVLNWSSGSVLANEIMIFQEHGSCFFVFIFFPYKASIPSNKWFWIYDNLDGVMEDFSWPFNKLGVN